MSLRRRLLLVAVVAVGVTVLLASTVTWFTMRGELRGEVDDALTAQARLIEDRGPSGPGRRGGPGPGPGPGPIGRDGFGHGRFPAPPQRRGGTADYIQELEADGTVRARNSDAATLPVTDRDLEVAAGERSRFFSDRNRDGERVRVLTIPVANRASAVQLARSLESTDRVLDRMRLILLLLCAAATAAAVAASRILTKPILRPVGDLHAAASHIEATGDLSRRVPVAGDDEVGRLAGQFNAMLERVEGAQTAQRQLVADASHELRTPVTSLRTNAEVLREGKLSPAQQETVLDDIVLQSEELSALVADIIDLARGDLRSTAAEELDLAELAAEAIDRARRHQPGLTFAGALEPSLVHADPSRLSRAINNLLDNAAKYSPEGGTVDVTVAAGAITVRDHGPGIPADELPRVFERFYRGAAAREHPGSGLGLAIVKQVADSHGGTVTIGPAEGGGTVAMLSLPVAG